VNHLASYVEFKPEPALSAAITRIGELARECGDKDREIAKLRQEIAALKNRSIKAYKGCKLLEVDHDDASVVLEYDYQAAVRESWDEPPSQAQADLIRVWIGGAPFSYEVFSDAQVKAWEAECLAAEGSE
jgi:hypothetical protein